MERPDHVGDLERRVDDVPIVLHKLDQRLPVILDSVAASPDEIPNPAAGGRLDPDGPWDVFGARAVRD